MSNKKKDKQGESEWNERAKEIWLAGLGALAAVEDEGNKLFKSLVSRGSEYEKKRKEQIEEMWEDVSGRFQEVEDELGDKYDKAEEKIEKNFKSVISGLGIPTRKEVKDLSNKVDALIEKLEKMEKKETGDSGTSKGSTGKK